jgi:hypothetical protein
LYCRPVQARCGGEPNILGDDAFGNAQRGGNLFVRKLGGSFKRDMSLILRIVILGAGMLSPDKKLEAYPLGCLYA